MKIIETYEVDGHEYEVFQCDRCKKTITCHGGGYADPTCPCEDMDEEELQQMIQNREEKP